MALATHSVFYYGHKIDDTNNLINFKEGAGAEKTAQIPIGSYTLTKFLDVVTAALNSASALDWAYTLNRTTGVVTLISSGTASLLWATGSNAASTPANLLGFVGTDVLNLTSFTGNARSGYAYSPQFPLQDYKGPEKTKRLVNAVVTKSATGDSVSVQSFGVERFMKCDVKYITNQPSEGVLRNDPEAIENALQFMEYIVEKHPIEFMESENDVENFIKVYLESTQQGSSGTEFELIEYVDRNLPEFFGTGMLTFKVINNE